MPHFLDVRIGIDTVTKSKKWCNERFAQAQKFSKSYYAWAIVKLTSPRSCSYFCELPGDNKHLWCSCPGLCGSVSTHVKVPTSVCKNQRFYSQRRLLHDRERFKWFINTLWAQSRSPCQKSYRSISDRLDRNWQTTSPKSWHKTSSKLSACYQESHMLTQSKCIGYRDIYRSVDAAGLDDRIFFLHQHVDESIPTLYIHIYVYSSNRR